MQASGLCMRDWFSNEGESFPLSNSHLYPLHKRHKPMTQKPQTNKLTIYDKQALSPYITHATGLDISPQMLQQYTSLLTTSHPSLPILTAVADLVSPTPAPGIAGPEFHNYDIAAIALGFHHFGDPKGCVQRLVQRLKQGGVLLVVDWLPSEYPNGGDKDTEEWQRMKKTIKHNGFTEEDMRGIFEGAGLVDFGFVVLGEEFELQMNGKEVKKTGFIAKGRKA